MFPSDWYWIVDDGPAASVYASRLNDYVLETDPTYQAWLLLPNGIDTGHTNAATHIDTEFNLGGVLASYPALRPTPAGVLDGFKAGRAEVAIADPLFPVEFDQENRIRALEGLPPITLNQFRLSVQNHQ